MKSHIKPPILMGCKKKIEQDWKKSEKLVSKSEMMPIFNGSKPANLW
jgi:hypothetical protein